MNSRAREAKAVAAARVRVRRADAQSAQRSDTQRIRVVPEAEAGQAERAGQQRGQQCGQLGSLAGLQDCRRTCDAAVGCGFQQRLRSCSARLFCAVTGWAHFGLAGFLPPFSAPATSSTS